MSRFTPSHPDFSVRLTFTDVVNRIWQVGLSPSTGQVVEINMTCDCGLKPSVSASAFVAVTRIDCSCGQVLIIPQDVARAARQLVWDQLNEAAKTRKRGGGSGLVIPDC